MSLAAVSESPDWRVDAAVRELEPGLAEVTVTMRAEKDFPPAPLRVTFTHPLRDAVGMWRSGAGFGKALVQDWRGEAVWSSSIASGAPVVEFFNDGSENVFSVACSESVGAVEFRSGIVEEAPGLRHTAEFRAGGEAPLREAAVSFLVDTRPVFYAQSIGGACDWCAERSGADPDRSAPASAFAPVFSSWYAFKQNVTAAAVERECALAKDFGFGTVIVDDGWQTADSRGGYAFCGDWRADERKFPDFAKHVGEVRASGLRHMLWFAVPFIGERSENFKRFLGKYLYHDSGLGASALDPRFPEVREFLAGVCERAVSEWGLDGFKLDFLDAFHIRGEDPAAAVGAPAGRDIPSLPRAVDRLLEDILRTVLKIRPDALLEFRQPYVGPSMRKYGNMFRVGDCAYGAAQNRVGTLDLRLSSGRAAVHSDMLVWDAKASVEDAALQFLNVLFAVPQVSVRLGELSAGHRRMLQSLMAFQAKHSETLLFGELRPMRPDLNYPVVYAYGKGEQIAAVYDADQIARFDSSRGTAWIVNATGSDRLFVEFDGKLLRLPIDRSSFARVTDASTEKDSAS